MIWLFWKVRAFLEIKTVCVGKRTMRFCILYKNEKKDKRRACEWERQ